MRMEAYKNGKKIGYNQTSAMLTELKQQDEYAFLRNVDSIALQQSLRDLNTAFTNFFQKRAKHPVFKSKHHNHQSYRTINQGGITISGNRIRLPKIGFVKVKQSMEIGIIHNVTITKTASGKYYAILNVDFEPEEKQTTTNTIGIDVGLSHFYTDSKGNIIDNPKYLEKSMRKLIREQRKLSRKQKGSSNRNKQRIKVASVHEKVANQRNDFLQKESTRLINENQVICLEDLNVKNMMRNHKLAQSIASASWYKFFQILEYKSVWYKRIVIKAKTLFPSSQICHCCGYQNPLVKNLTIRKWSCPNCHAIHDRDMNAAINIEVFGLQTL